MTTCARQLVKSSEREVAQLTRHSIREYHSHVNLHGTAWSFDLKKKERKKAKLAAGSAEGAAARSALSPNWEPVRKITPTKVARPADGWSTTRCSCRGEPAAARRGRLGLQPLRRGEKRSTRHLTHERQQQYRCSAHAERGSDTHREGGREGRRRRRRRRTQPLEEAVDLVIVWSADWYSSCAIVSIESPREAW